MKITSMLGSSTLTAGRPRGIIVFIEADSKSEEGLIHQIMARDLAAQHHGITGDADDPKAIYLTLEFRGKRQ